MSVLRPAMPLEGMKESKELDIWALLICQILLDILNLPNRSESTGRTWDIGPNRAFVPHPPVSKYASGF
jgi:hypothetical protein